MSPDLLAKSLMTAATDRLNAEESGSYQTTSVCHM